MRTARKHRHTYRIVRLHLFNGPGYRVRDGEAHTCKCGFGFIQPQLFDVRKYEAA